MCKQLCQVTWRPSSQTALLLFSSSQRGTSFPWSLETEQYVCSYQPQQWFWSTLNVQSYTCLHLLAYVDHCKELWFVFLMDEKPCLFINKFCIPCPVGILSSGSCHSHIIRHSSSLKSVHCGMDYTVLAVHSVFTCSISSWVRSAITFLPNSLDVTCPVH